jgi:phosphate transport system permease protein
MFLFFLISCILIFIFYKLALRKFTASTITRENRKQIKYFGSYVVLWSCIPSVIFFLILYFSTNIWINTVITAKFISNEPLIVQEIVQSQLPTLIKQLSDTNNLENVEFTSSISKERMIDMVTTIVKYQQWQQLLLYGIFVILFIILASLLLNTINIKGNFHHKVERIIKFVLFLFASIAIFTTVGVICSLLVEAIKFFSQIPITQFLFGSNWHPEDYELDPENSFGVIPLLSGTLLIAIISVSTAIILGLSAAIYMSEYMSSKKRKIVKPILEILAGIPSIVYGFFAAITFAPFLVNCFSFFGIQVENENALTAGLVMGIMLIPFISSLSDDMLHAVPKSLREGAMGMGSMKNEMIRKVLLPSAFHGIMAAVLLAVSRAVGETMIVVMASSLAANLTFNPLEPVTTITTQIVMLIQGDQEFNSPKTLVAFALGLLLLCITLVFNIIAVHIVNKYKEKYD